MNVQDQQVLEGSQFPVSIAQVVCAEYVIDKLKDIDFEMSLDEQYNYILRRWYDKNIKVSHAMEYLKHAPDEIRTQLALDIIEHIEKNAEK